VLFAPPLFPPVPVVLKLRTPLAKDPQERTLFPLLSNIWVSVPLPEQVKLSDPLPWFLLALILMVATVPEPDLVSKRLEKKGRAVCFGARYWKKENSGPYNYQ